MAYFWELNALLGQVISVKLVFHQVGAGAADSQRLNDLVPHLGIKFGGFESRLLCLVVDDLPD